MNHAPFCMAHGQGGAEIREDCSPTLTCNHEAPIAFTSKDYGGDASSDLCPTLRSMGHNESHPNGGGQVAVAYAFQPRIARNGRGDMGEVVNSLTAQAGDTGKGDAAPCVAICVTGEVTHTLKAEGFDASEDGTGRGQPIVAVGVDFRNSEITGELSQTLQSHHRSYSLNSLPAVMTEMAVRRLMPVECERLQGFPDNWTRIPIRHYKDRKVTATRPAQQWEPDPNGGWWLMAADGPRYKQCGNSMAVNVMRWIGRRVQAALPGSNGGPICNFSDFIG